MCCAASWRAILNTDFSGRFGWNPSLHAVVVLGGDIEQIRQTDAHFARVVWSKLVRAWSLLRDTGATGGTGNVRRRLPTLQRQAFRKSVTTAECVRHHTIPESSASDVQNRKLSVVKPLHRPRGGVLNLVTLPVHAVQPQAFFALHALEAIADDPGEHIPEYE